MPLSRDFRLSHIAEYSEGDLGPIQDFPTLNSGVNTYYMVFYAQVKDLFEEWSDMVFYIPVKIDPHKWWMCFMPSQDLSHIEDKI